MPDFQLIGIDSFGTEEWVGEDEEGRIILKSVYKTAATNAVLEDNLREQTENPKNQTTDKAFRKVASIPLLIHELWKQQYGTDPLAPGNEALLTRLLNDPEWRELRTDSGRVKIERR